MSTSVSNQEQKPLRLSGKDVVVPLTPTDVDYYKDRLEVAVILLGSIISEMYSPDRLRLAFRQAKAHRPRHIPEEDYLNFLGMAYGEAEKIRRRNPLSKMF